MKPYHITPSPENIKFRPHTLFVEGAKKSLDPTILGALLRDLDIFIEPLGSSAGIKGAAHALRPSHPRYYFLIDRDHRDEQEVEKSWKTFRGPAADNLLIWRKRELENYFLDPEYLKRSPALKCSETTLKEEILSLSSHRVYFEIANLVIAKIREEQQKGWIKTFPKNQGFETREKALARLKNLEGLKGTGKKIGEKVAENFVEREFNRVVKTLLDGAQKPQWGRGIWLQMIKGSEILPTVLNKYFQKKGPDQKEQRREITRQLLMDLPLADQPSDFQELHRLIEERVKGP